MEKDIQEIENPSMKKVLYPESSPINKPLPELSERQKSSPFLNSPEKSNFLDENRPKSNQDYAQINKIIQPKLDSKIKMSGSSDSNKIFLLLSFLIIIFFSVGTYYFIATRKTATNNSSDPIGKNDKKMVDDQSMINTNNPNYLTIDISDTDPILVKKALEKNIQNITRAGLKTPIEFIAVDMQNNPIAFSDFARISNITLSPEMLSFIEKSFSLFLFDDKGNPGIGLVLGVTDPLLAKNQISQEEPLLHKEFESIFPYSDFPIPTTEFRSAQYKNHAIRYQNLISPQKLSIDYAFQGDRLIFATTQQTIEAIIDKLGL
jgi:hypothetical protein